MITPLYSPESNDVVERKNKTLKEMMNAMLVSSHAPNNFSGWNFIVHMFSTK